MLDTDTLLTTQDCWEMMMLCNMHTRDKSQQYYKVLHKMVILMQDWICYLDAVQDDTDSFETLKRQFLL